MKINPRICISVFLLSIIIGLVAYGVMKNEWEGYADDKVHPVVLRYSPLAVMDRGFATYIFVLDTETGEIWKTTLRWRDQYSTGSRTKIKVVSEDSLVTPVDMGKQ